MKWKTLLCETDTLLAYATPPRGSGKIRGRASKLGMSNHFAYLRQMVPVRNQIVYPNLKNGEVVAGPMVVG